MKTQQTSLFHIGTLTGHPIDAPQGQIYVRSQFVQFRFPALPGGLIWNRPAAVVVRSLTGQETTLPILDVTRIVMMALTGLSLATLFVSIIMRRKTSRS
jgi:sugar lactone lactonase YvrE